MVGKEGSLLLTLARCCLLTLGGWLLTLARGVPVGKVLVDIARGACWLLTLARRVADIGEVLLADIGGLVADIGKGGACW